MSRNWDTKLPKWLRLGFILFSIAFSTGASANQNQKPEDIRALIEKAREAWIAQDANALTQLFTPDAEIILPGQKWRGQARIREEVTRFAQQYSDVKIVIQRTIVEKNQAVVQWYYEDTEKATGRRNKADDAIIIDFKDGRISRWREYFDTETPKAQTARSTVLPSAK